MRHWNWSLACLALLAPNLASADPINAIERIRNDPQAPLLAAAIVPSGTTLYYLSGQLPAVNDASKPPTSIEAYGDTKTQAVSVFNKIQTLLQGQGLSLADVVKLTVYLVGDPKTGGKVDFKGFGSAYDQFFGTPTQPNLVARTTVQVAALSSPGCLVEIEATAARPSTPTSVPKRPTAP